MSSSEEALQELDITKVEPEWKSIAHTLWGAAVFSVESGQPVPEKLVKHVAAAFCGTGPVYMTGGVELEAVEKYMKKNNLTYNRT